MLKKLNQIYDALVYQGLLWRILDIVIGGGKRFYGLIIASVIFSCFTSHDSVSFGIYMAYVTAWSGLETHRAGDQ